MKKLTHESYGKPYYTTLNYSNYLERELKYNKFGEELVEFLKKIKLLNYSTKILDYGCALGFTVLSFRKLEYHCDGYDISKWAKKECSKRGIKYVKYKKSKYDLMLCMDVFEHMTDKQIIHSLKTFNPDHLLIRIPCSTNGGKSFHLDISNNDPTHINCKDKKDWFDLFDSVGYKNRIILNLYTIYDTDGVMCYILSKQ